MLKKSLFTIVMTLSLLVGAVSPAFAGGANTAKVDFGSCLNPKWTLSQTNVSSEKTHGVLGKSGGFAGTDKIYTSGNNVLQCLCKDDKGYQTNWLEASKLSKDEVNVYKKNGWTMAAGSNWGLKDAPYLGKTTEYACKPKIAGFAKTGMFEQNLVNLVALFGALSLALGYLSFKRAKRSI